MAVILSTTGSTTTYYPNSAGVHVPDDSLIAVSGAAGISGNLEYKTSENTWVDVPDSDGNATLAPEYLKPILGGNGLFVRIKVTQAPTTDAPYAFHVNFDGRR